MEADNSLSRKELYDLVWSKPVYKILDEYSITHSLFKKICKANDIPLPINGYWQKLRHKKKVDKIELPETNKQYSLIKLFVSPDENDPDSFRGLSQFSLLVRNIKNDKTLPLKVPEKLVNPDAIIRRTKDYYKRRKSDDYRHQTKMPKEGVFSVDVSKGIEGRTYRFADALIKLFRKRGHDIKILTNQQYYNENGTKMFVFGERYSIRIRESNIRVMEQHPKFSWKEAKYYPSGKLTLKLDDFYGYTWSDSKTKLLEDKLAEILAFMELRAKKDIQEEIERKIRQAERERLRKIEEEQKQRRDKELRAFKAVINHSSGWQKSMDLRNYIKAVEQNAIENNKLTPELKTWLKWINDKADWYDPLIEKEDELFVNIDRESI
ncbi:hypothetical protein [Aestuariibaculum sediminum]|uniref:Uncharacterized protein n=1 Tax=Aestuariibaculum sediminum TaxID=2770637 RepID=A0A8J6U8N0_9FLAO|nr:hypothetical protein [Aestuariibaculum sediminum]MBD0831827.1 hypothetical protein [Aestuariibaculum sediminum]